MDDNFLMSYGDIIFQFGNETLPDIAEVAVDQLMDDGFLKDVPIVGTVFKAGKLLADIHNIFVTKHMLVFAQKYNSGNISNEKIKKHLEDLNKHPKKKIQEMETILQNANNVAA